MQPFIQLLQAMLIDVSARPSKRTEDPSSQEGGMWGECKSQLVRVRCR
jgi:hypothetical protein